MQYVEGYDLAKLVEKNGPLPVAHACNFVYQAALGLQHAHERGMVHRDIKPSNLMLAREGNKPVDQDPRLRPGQGDQRGGRRRRPDPRGPDARHAPLRRPRAELNAQKADIRADIYSLGCTLYCLLAGHPPFDAASLYELLQAHHSMDAKPLNFIRPEVPAELAAVVAKMLAKEPERRFQTPGEVAKALMPFFKKGSVIPGGAKAEVSVVGDEGVKQVPLEAWPRESVSKDEVAPVPVSQCRSSSPAWSPADTTNRQCQNEVEQETPGLEAVSDLAQRIRSSRACSSKRSGSRCWES